MTSAAGIQSALAEWTDEIWLECLTFDHDSLPSPIRLVNDNQNLSRAAGTFIAFPFTFQDVVRSEDQTGFAQIVADNVDQRIVSSLRGITGRPTVSYEAVLRSSPNTVERGPIDFEVVSFGVTASTISLRVSFAMSFLSDAFPAGLISPLNAVAI